MRSGYLITVVLLLTSATSLYGIDTYPAAGAGAQWLVDKQGPIGGWNRYGPGPVAQALRAFALAGRTGSPPAILLRDGLLARQSATGSWNESVGETAEATWALVLSGQDPGSPEVQSAVSWLKSKQSSDGSWLGQTYYTSVSLIALVTAGENNSSPAILQGVNWLKSNQNPDGYWGMTPGGASTMAGIRAYPATALCLADSPSSTHVQEAVEWLWSNTQSDAEFQGHTLFAFVHANADPARIATIAEWLLTNQNPDGSWTWLTPPFAAPSTANVLSGLAQAQIIGAPVDNGFAWIELHVSAEGIYSDGGEDCGATALPVMALSSFDPALSALTAALDAWRDSQPTHGGWVWLGFYTTSVDYAVYTTAHITWAMASGPYAAQYPTTIQRATSNLITGQNPDGGWGATGDGTTPSEASRTTPALLALLHAGYSASDAAVADGLSWLILNRTGVAWGSATPQAILALDLADAYGAQKELAVDWLVGQQNADGGWFSGVSTVGGTAWALIALDQIGGYDAERVAGATWLMNAQRVDGGWSNILGPGVSATSSVGLATWALSLEYNDPNPIVAAIVADAAEYTIDQTVTLTATTSEPDCVVSLSLVDPAGWSRRLAMTQGDPGVYTLQPPLDRYYRPGTYSVGITTELPDGRRGFANTDFDVLVHSDLPGDLNGDWRVDLEDYALFQPAFTGP